LQRALGIEMFDDLRVPTIAAVENMVFIIQSLFLKAI